MHRCTACIVVLIIVLVVIVMTWRRRPVFSVQPYPPAPYGYSRITRISGIPTSDFGQIDTNCTVQLAAIDSNNYRYKLSVAGTINTSFVFVNTSGAFPPTHLTYSGFTAGADTIDNTVNGRFDLTVSYSAGTLTIVHNRDPRTAFTLVVAP